MQVTVTFRHLASSDGVRSYAVEKIERLQKFVRGLVEAHVILSVLKRHHVAEVVLTGKNLSLTAKAETGDLYAAIDLVADKVERQLKRRAAKRKQHRAEPVSRAGGRALAEAASESVDIKRQRVAVRSLSLEQALSRLRQSKNGFVLFENKDTEGLALLYRRGDGQIALVEPELPA